MPENKSVPLFIVPVVGVRFGFKDETSRHTFEKNIKQGMRVTLQKEDDNRYDHFAVVATCAIGGCKDFQQIGRVSADYLGRVRGIMKERERISGEPFPQKTLSTSKG